MAGHFHTVGHANGGVLDGHPEASAGLRAAVQGLEKQLAELLAARLDPLSKEVTRLKAQRAALEAENARLKTLLEEAGSFKRYGSEEAASAKRYGSEEQPGRRQLRLQTSPGGPRRVRSPSEADRAATRKPTLLASVAAFTSSSSSAPQRSAASAPGAALKGSGVYAEVEDLASRPSRVVTITEGELGPAEAPPESIALPTEGAEEVLGGGLEADADSVAPEVEVQPIWKDMNTPATIKKGIFHRNNPLKKRPASFLGKGAQNLETLILPPTANRRIIWETIGAVSIIYDLIVVPLQAFNLQFEAVGERLRQGMLNMHIVYWTLDIPCSFFVGYHVNGVLETRVRKTAKRYLTSWFFLDLVLVSIDWIMFVADAKGRTETTNFSYLMYGRVLRLLRFVRLVRLFKLHSLFNKILESIQSEYVLTFLRVSEHVLLIVLLNHFIACGWYAIGRMADNPNVEKDAWIDTFRDSDLVGYRYVTSLHWSLTQFTPASMEVFPTNVGERSYNVVVVILAMVIFSTFISSITESMTRLRKTNLAKAAQYQTLRQYLGENQVSMQLAMRIWKYLEHGAKARRQRRLWRDVELLGGIPESLQMDLHHEVYTPFLCGHHFFSFYNEQSRVAMRAICHYSAQEVSLVTDQVLFSQGQVADKMYFVIEGLLEYQVFSEDLPGASISKHLVTYPGWLAEAVLWIRWFYHGTAAAKQVSSLIALHVPTMHQIMREYLGPIPFCCNYAERFAAYARANLQSVSDVFEEDLSKIEAMAQEAWDHVEAATQHLNPNPVMTVPEHVVAPKPASQGRRGTWRRKSIGSVLSGGWSCRRSSKRGNTVPDSILGSTSSLASTIPENNAAGDDRAVTPPLLQAPGAPGVSQPGQSSAAQARGGLDVSAGIARPAAVNDCI